MQKLGHDVNLGKISTETYKRGTEVQVVLILNMTCMICYNNKMLRSSLRLCCRLGIMRGCDVWIDTGRDLRGIACGI